MLGMGSADCCLFAQVMLVDLCARVEDRTKHSMGGVRFLILALKSEVESF